MWTGETGHPKAGVFFIRECHDEVKKFQEDEKMSYDDYTQEMADEAFRKGLYCKKCGNSDITKLAFGSDGMFCKNCRILDTGIFSLLHRKYCKSKH